MSNNASRCSVFILPHRDLLVYAHIHRLLVSLPHAPSLVTTAISLSPDICYKLSCASPWNCPGGMGNATKGSVLMRACNSTWRWPVAGSRSMPDEQRLASRATRPRSDSFRLRAVSWPSRSPAVSASPGRRRLKSPGNGVARLLPSGYRLSSSVRRGLPKQSRAGAAHGVRASWPESEHKEQAPGTHGQQNRTQTPVAATPW